MFDPKDIIDPPYPDHAPCDERDLSVVKYLGVHHSDTGANVGPLDIDQMHRARGFVMIGYSFVVARDGKIYRGRELHWVPAAAQGENTVSADICLIGQYEPTAAGYNGPVPYDQWQSLIQISAWVHKIIPSIEKTLGHHELGLLATPCYLDQCPGKDVEDHMDELRASIAALM